MPEGFGKRHLLERQGRSRPPAQQVDRDGRKHFKRDHCRERIAGQAEDRRAAHAGEYQRLAGLHADPGEEDLGTEVREHLFHQVVLAHRDAARQKQQVATQSVFDPTAGLVEPVPRDWQDPRPTAATPHLRRQGMGIGIADLVRLRLRVNGQDFVTSGEDCDLRLAVDRHGGATDGAEKCDLGVPDGHARRKHAITLGCLGAGHDEITPGSNGALQRDRVPGADRVLHHDDRVGTSRTRRPRHDLDRLARLQGELRRLSGACFPEDLQRCRDVRDVRGDHGESVPRGAVERGVVTVCQHIPGQDAAQRRV